MELKTNPARQRRAGFVGLRNRIQNCGSAVAAAAVSAAESRGEVRQRAVLAQTVCKRQQERPSAAGEGSRRKYVESARSQNEQDDESPKATVAIQTHGFSSLFAAEYVCFPVPQLC